jgi:hypothetical protein
LHSRQTIRELFETALAGVPATVMAGRIAKLDEANLPAVLVYSKRETSNFDRLGYTSLRRELHVTVEIIAQADYDDIDDTLDDLAVAVETALGGTVVKGPTIDDVELISTDFDNDTTGEKALGRCTMVYKLFYYTASDAPQTLRD